MDLAGLWANLLELASYWLWQKGTQSVRQGNRWEQQVPRNQATFPAWEAAARIYRLLANHLVFDRGQLEGQVVVVALRSRSLKGQSLLQASSQEASAQHQEDPLAAAEWC